MEPNLARNPRPAVPLQGQPQSMARGRGRYQTDRSGRLPSPEALVDFILLLAIGADVSPHGHKVGAIPHRNFKMLLGLLVTFSPIPINSDRNFLLDVKNYPVIFFPNQQKFRTEISRKTNIGYELNERDNWTIKKLVSINLLFLGLGAVAGMTGHGGGFFWIPVFLSMGFGNQVSAATSLFVVFWSKLAVSVLFGINGELPFAFLVRIFYSVLIGFRR